MVYQVFVYGSLLTGERNHKLLTNAKKIAGQAWATGQLFETSSYYPAMVPSDHGLVYGELYEIDDQQLVQLDELEGFSPNDTESLFQRENCLVTTDTNRYQAFTYYLNPNHQHLLKELVPFGDWKVQQLLKGEYGQLYYYAYGSCMDHERFQKAGVDHHFQENLGRGHLDGFSLKFAMKGPHGGAADIIEDGGEVEGVIYKVDRAAIDYLFVREGVEAGWYRPAVISVFDSHGDELPFVLTFIVINKADESMPSQLYATEILRGGQQTLSKGYLLRLQDRLKQQFNMDLDII